MAENTIRIFVEKNPGFRVEAESLRDELNENLSLSIRSLRYINVYDLAGFSEELLGKCEYSVFGETVTDLVSREMPLEGKRYLAVEYIPGQFDQRASSAVDCVHLIDPKADIQIRSSKLLIFDDDMSEKDLEAVRHYYINAVESREKDLSRLSPSEKAEVTPVQVLDGFIDMPESEFAAFCSKWGLAMNTDDLREVVKYFTAEKRNPSETELRILDTYWSDHCRHTTFTSELTEITVDDSFIRSEIESELGQFHYIRKELGREGKSLCLMELATIGARDLRSKGLLEDLEQSEENNACSIFINVDVDEDAAGVVLLADFHVVQQAALAQTPGSDGGQFHEAEALALAAELLAYGMELAELRLYLRLDEGIIDFDFLKFRGEGSMTAMVAPICVKDAEFRFSRIPFLIPEISYDLVEIVDIHRKTPLLAELSIFVLSHSRKSGQIGKRLHLSFFGRCKH